MKKLIAVLMALTLAVSLFACEESSGSVQSKADLQSASLATSFAAEAQLYLPNENVDGFVLETEAFDTNIATLIDMLVERGAIPQGSEVNDFTQDGSGGAVLDMNAAYGSGVASTGSTGEYIMIGSLVNTVLKTCGLERLRITVEGNPLETGHEVYLYELTFFENQDGGEAAADTGDPAAVWQRLDGYWNAANGRFVRFAEKEGDKLFDFGLWESGFGMSGSAFELALATDEELETGVRFSETSDTDAFEALVRIDFSGLERDGKIRVSIETDDNGEWKQYAYAGATAQEAMQTLHADDETEQGADDENALTTAELWEQMSGYWNTMDGTFVGFGSENGVRTLDYGIWGTSFGRSGTAFELSEISAYNYEIGVRFPEIAASDMEDGSPETVSVFELDASGLMQGDNVRISIDGGEWEQYFYAGATAQEASGWVVDPSAGAVLLSVDEFWEKVQGFWVSEHGYVAGFTEAKLVKSFQFASLKAGTGKKGNISGLMEDGGNIFVMKAALGGASSAVGKIAKEKLTTVQIDAGSLVSDQTLSMKVGDDIWREYSYAGSSIKDVITELPSEKEPASLGGLRK